MAMLRLLPNSPWMTLKMFTPCVYAAMVLISSNTKQFTLERDHTKFVFYYSMNHGAAAFMFVEVK